MLSQGDLARMSEFLRETVFCQTCNGQGQENGCPLCGLWPGLGSHRMVNNEKYFFMGNLKKYSFDYWYHVLLKKLGTKIFFDQALDRLNRPLPNYVSLWGAFKT